MMEVDSMSADIKEEEKYINTFTIIYFRNIFVSSRRKYPYKVHLLKFIDFLNFKAAADTFLKKKTTDENGDTVNWLQLKFFKFRTE